MANPDTDMQTVEDVRDPQRPRDLPDDAAREEAVAEDELRQDAVPDDAVRDDAVADDAVRDEAIPEDAVRDDAVRLDEATAPDGDERVGDERVGDEQEMTGPEDDRVEAEDAPEPPDVRAESDYVMARAAVPEGAAVTEPPDELDRAADTREPEDAAADVREPAQPVSEPGEMREPVTESGEMREPVTESGEMREPVTEPGEMREPAETREPAMASAGMLPDAEPAAPVSPLWSGDAARSLRDRFRELQLAFLDDPRATADAADALVGEMIDSLRTALAEQHRELRAWQDSGAEDTEQLRIAVRRYRDLIDRVLAL
jgi:hypothetical protein